MAVQKSKKTPSKRGMRRSHSFLSEPPISIDIKTGEKHLYHHISPKGFYKGRKILKNKL
ncbi:50S ribosomal protein L32 [Candidatus Profftella armatura]|uniref:Large ribosomal subunit protein bL32 n=1 Tax=Candidatus Profftella armatura TaxID=669502 RepID=S5R438_9PROT|nr:50S ribosomal protein L32 [Candidatus Profftella armatura]AGS06984.1 50S ribosomal protein L32 [Candidatus Profftella armatura]ALC96049.1 50S ribosomal protein L32 [Candidatus Profftella armatura]QLK13882.1 50S ribosomal protein L32 [Candidatus Profftella armatura]